jgi:chemotaxis protein MotD
VPQVAFDTKIHVHDRSLPRFPRSAHQSDRAPSPFESLLDDGAQAPDPSPPPQPENKTAPADAAHAPTQNNDTKLAAPNGAAPTIKSGPGDNPDDDEKPVANEKADANANAKTAAAASDSIKTADNADDNPVNQSKSDNSAIAPTTDSGKTITATDAVSLVAPIAVPDHGLTSNPNNGQSGQLLDLPAIVANGAPSLKGFNPGAAKAAGKQVDPEKKDGVETQIDTDQSIKATVDDSQTAAKSAPQAHVDNTPLAVSDSDKEHVAQLRNEIATNGHHDADTALVSADANTAAPTATGDTAAPSAAIANSAPAAPAAAAPAAQAAPQPAAIPLAGVAIEIAGKALAGKNRFEIRLDPPELGRIEVRLDVDRDGNVTSRLTVDRADTLDLLRRDVSGLERALQDAGLKTTDNGLQFSLRDQSMGQQQTSGGSDTAQIVVQDELPPSIDVPPQNYGRLAGQGGGLDIRV